MFEGNKGITLCTFDLLAWLFVNIFGSLEWFAFLQSDLILS